MTATHPIASTVLVAIDISKHRHEVLIGVPGKKHRRRLTITNALEDFQRLQPFGIGDLHAVVSAPPVVDGRVADPVPAAQILCRHASLMSPHIAKICASLKRLLFLVCLFSSRTG